MSLLSDITIKKLLGNDIIIQPFDESALTPVGYDFSIGDFVYSLEHGVLESENGYYQIPAKSTIQILTKESLWVSGKISGTFHSKVSLVCQGFSHISTTLDPGWFGPLLITTRNNTDKPINLAENAKFVTLIFYKNSKKTNTPHNKPQYRQDILAGQLQQQTDAYIRKISSLLSNEQALIDFRTLVNNANAPMISKIKASITKQKIYSSLNKIAIFITIILIIAVSGLNFYWNNINSYFYGIIYDSKIFAAQTAATLGLITLLISLVRNK